MTGAAAWPSPAPAAGSRDASPSSPTPQAELLRMHATGDYTIAELMEVFSVGRATVYRTLDRGRSREGASHA